MKKQYDFYETLPWKYVVILYHDGKEIDRKKMSGDELEEYIERLIAHGFTRGYSPEVVEKARREYEYYYRNRIGAEEPELKPTSKASKERWILECRINESSPWWYWAGYTKDGPTFTEHLMMAETFKSSEDAIAIGQLLLGLRDIVHYKVYMEAEDGEDN